MPKLNIPALNQRNNQVNPDGACNVTCVAMCLRYFGIKGNGNGQLEDQLYKRALEIGYPGDPLVMQALVKEKGLKGSFTYSGTLKAIRSAIDAGNPVILHGEHTASGHVVVCNGYDDKGFWVIDPYGIFNTQGYDRNTRDSEVTKGASEHYSLSLFNRVFCGGGQLWVHVISK